MIQADLFPYLIDQNFIKYYLKNKKEIKKIDRKIGKIARENINKSHKIIILKGKSAQEEINKLPEMEKHRYSLHSSMTEEKSKIIVVEVDKNIGNE